MAPQKSEKLILAAGIAVLAISLAVPAFQKLTEMHGVRAIASRVADVPRRLVSSGEPAKTLTVQVKSIVDGLSPDAALADAKLRNNENSKSGMAKPDATPLRPQKNRRASDSDSEDSEVKVVVEWSADGKATKQARKSKHPRKWTFSAQ